jgi:hypothetical protein
MVAGGWWLRRRDDDLMVPMTSGRREGARRVGGASRQRGEGETWQGQQG